MKDVDYEECCGSPTKCAYDASKGRCRTREQFEKALEKSNSSQRLTMSNMLWLSDPETLIKVQREIIQKNRNTIKREREKDDYGRTLTR